MCDVVTLVTDIRVDSIRHRSRGREKPDTTCQQWCRRTYAVSLNRRAPTGFKQGFCLNRYTETKWFTHWQVVVVWKRKPMSQILPRERRRVCYSKRWTWQYFRLWWWHGRIYFKVGSDQISQELCLYAHTHKILCMHCVEEWLLRIWISIEATSSQNLQSKLVCCVLAHEEICSRLVSFTSVHTCVWLGSWSEETALVVSRSSWFWSGTCDSSDRLPNPHFSVCFPEKAAVQGQWDPCLAFKSQHTDHILV